MEIIDYLLARKKAGGGSDVTIEQLNATENGTYSEEGIAYSPVVVNVPAPANSYQLKDVPSGTVSTIDDGTALPMPSLKVGIEPVQEGSGDPSPDNIRPISGWTAANVTRTEVNQLDESTGHTDNNYRYFNVPLGENNLLYMSLTDKDTSVNVSDCSVGFTDIDGNGERSYRWILQNGTVNINHFNKAAIGIVEKLCKFIFVYPNTEEAWNRINQRFYVSVNYPSTDTEYHAYNGQTYTIQFKDGDNPLTVYGGTLDVTSGELVVDRAKINMGYLNWAYDTSYNRFVSSYIPNTKTPSGARIVSFVSSMYEVVSDGRPISQMASGQMYSSFDSAQTNAIVMVHDNRFTDAALFKNAVTGQSFVYELAEPITYHLTPTQVRTLVGNNNIWADTGNIIEGKYFKSLV